MTSAKTPHLKNFDFYNYPLLMPVKRTIFEYIGNEVLPLLTTVL